MQVWHCFVVWSVFPTVSLAWLASTPCGSSTVMVDGYTRNHRLQFDCRDRHVADDDGVGSRISSQRRRKRQRLHDTIRGDGEYGDDDEYEYEYDDGDDVAEPNIDIADFRIPRTKEAISYGWNRGRSSPMIRKALGGKASDHCISYLCSNCGSEFVKYFGKCPTCREWNTLQAHSSPRNLSSTPPRPAFLGVSSSSSSPRGNGWVGSSSTIGTVPVRITDVDLDAPESARWMVPNDDEFNLVMGGGISKGSLTLLGGEPGVGKSTLVVQIACALAKLSKTTSALSPVVWYVSGEETPHQIAQRAQRLQSRTPNLYLMQETHVDTLCDKVIAFQNRPPEEDESGLPTPPLGLLIVDSIQTMQCDAAGSGITGGVAQVRESVALLLRLAKLTAVPILLIGHVTKTGDVAGPRTIEHMVDTVLYLEQGDTAGSSNIRILRASKNRFGSTDEVGVYEMTGGRLAPVLDASALFLATRNELEDEEGCAIAILLEGKRAMAVEVQSLVTSAGGDFGRRTVNGIHPSRLALLLGVLQKRCGVGGFAKSDVYVNIVGQMKLEKGKASDLAIAMTLVSSVSSIAIRADTAFVGEVGLLGELRAVSSIEKRLQEANRMGFSRVVTPLLASNHRKGSSKTLKSTVHGMEWIQCRTLRAAIDEGLVGTMPKFGRKQRPQKKGEPDFPETIDDLGLDEEEGTSFQ